MLQVIEKIHGKSNQFIIQGMNEVYAKQRKMSEYTNETVLFIHEKISKVSPPIGIVKLKSNLENIKFRIIENGREDGILVETNQPVQVHLEENPNRTMIYVFSVQ